jgi:putative FmdB family regulatory protein
MPLYEYKCRRCDHKFEEIVRLDETPECPACHHHKPERLFSMSATVSTPRMRKRTEGQARRAAGKVHREKQAADREYERNYIKDHSS